jgi:hypothetical protein
MPFWFAGALVELEHGFAHCDDIELRLCYARWHLHFRCLVEQALHSITHPECFRER